MKKILFYINAIHHGGAEKVMVNLANRFADAGFEIIFVTSFYDSEEYILTDKVKRFSLEQNDLKQSIIHRNLSRIIKLRKMLKEKKPNIVVSFMGEANFRAIIATKFMGIKILISIRNDPNREYRSKIQKLAAKILYPFVDGCVFQTEDAKKWFSEKIQKKSRIILNQVDEKFYKINYSGVRKNIVTVGRLEPQKNQKLLIQAFSMIADNFPVEKLIIYGGGSLYGELVEYVAELGLRNRVIFKGPTMNIQEEIFDSKLFVLSSDYEGLPNAIMEAMTLGIPIISTDCPCGGPRLLIKNNESGILVPVRNVRKMADALYKILSDKVFAEKLSKYARLRSLDFEPQKVFSEWEKYILQIIK